MPHRFDLVNRRVGADAQWSKDRLGHHLRTDRGLIQVTHIIYASFPKDPFISQWPHDAHRRQDVCEFHWTTTGTYLPRGGLTD